MLQEKREDLDSEKQRQLLQRLVSELSQTQPELYYQPTSVIADQIKAYIDKGATLYAEERTLLRRLKRRDIQVLLSLH